MGQVYLAIHNGCYEGWGLEPYNTAIEALKVVREGGTYGQKWKILRELTVKVEEGGEDDTV